jgi:hypothetical protein
MKILKSIKASKSTGHDRIPPKLIKDAAEEIVASLTQIFNKSISTGIFPDGFEKLIFQQLSAYLENNNILTKKQAGIRKKQSTQASY